MNNSPILHNRVRCLLPLLAVVLTMTGCGGTSNLQSPAGVEQRLDLSGYETVVVGSFADRATETKSFKNNDKGREKRMRYVNEVQAASGTFSEFLVAEISSTGAFSEVRRGDAAEPGELFIDGDITRFARGNAAAKFLVGMGAGSTYFDAIVRLHDGPYEDVVGQIVVDKNSWVLGGVISATQNVESFMRGGAKKTAGELRDAKLGIVDQ